MNYKNWELIKQILEAPKIEDKIFEELKSSLFSKKIDFNSEKNKLKFLNQIEEIINFDFLYQKNIIAIGGGFSSGKSSFINSLMLDSIKNKLSIAIDATTAIPTYVVNTDKEFLKIYSKSGGITYLKEEYEELLTHQNLKEIGFNITNIMPYIVKGTKFKGKNLSNICFIDTPGYNSATTEITINDEDNSVNFLKNSSTIIWVISAVSNITENDVKILSSMENKKIYIILNKADRVLEEQLEEKIEQTIETLDENFIEIEGISAYSSLKPLKEYPYYKKKLFEFLEELNSEIDKVKEFKTLLEELFEENINHIGEKLERLNSEIEKIDNFIETIDNLNLDKIKMDRDMICSYLNSYEKKKREKKIDEYILYLNETDKKFERMNKLLDKIFVKTEEKIEKYI